MGLISRDTQPIRALIKWEKRVVFLENEWVFAVHGGKEKFETLFNKNVTIVGTRKFAHPILTRLKYGQFGYLESNEVALMYHPPSPTLTETIIDPRLFAFRGTFEETNSQLIVRGKFRTYSFARFGALFFVNSWLAASAIMFAIGVSLIVTESISNFSVGQMASGLFYLLATVSLAALGVFGMRGLFKLAGLGSLRASAEVYRLLTMFAGTDDSNNDKSG